MRRFEKIVTCSVMVILMTAPPVPSFAFVMMPSRKTSTLHLLYSAVEKDINIDDVLAEVEEALKAAEESLHHQGRGNGAVRNGSKASALTESDTESTINEDKESPLDEVEPWISDEQALGMMADDSGLDLTDEAAMSQRNGQRSAKDDDQSDEADDMFEQESDEEQVQDYQEEQAAFKDDSTPEEEAGGIIPVPRAKPVDKKVPTFVTIHGGSLRTWAFSDPSIKRMQMVLKTDGRPLNAIVDLWQGPGNTPQKMGVYIEDGNLRNFRTIIQTPWRGGQNAIAVRNAAKVEFPLAAHVEETVLYDTPLFQTERGIRGETIQGRSLKTYSFPFYVSSVQVLLETDGRPQNARIELLQGPNNVKQVIELYTEDGMDRPFFAILEMPGTESVIRIINEAPVEYPLTAHVESYEEQADADDRAPDDFGDMHQTRRRSRTDASPFGSFLSRLFNGIR